MTINELITKLQALPEHQKKKSAFIYCDACDDFYPVLTIQNADENSSGIKENLPVLWCS
jgi:hypothetical protein